MNIIIDIGHPAHVHVFRNYYTEMTSQGHVVHFTCRDKECTIQLLEHYRLPFTRIGKPFKGTITKLLGLFVFGWRIRQVALAHDADLFMSISSMYAAQCAWLMRKEHIVLDDTEHSGFEHMLYRPFSSIILTPSCFEKHMGRKQVRYDGFHELAYLHPDRLDPDHHIRVKLGIPTNEKFALLRFVSWNAAHDRNANGLSLAAKTDLINRLEKHCHVLISAEGALPAELESRRIRIAPQDMHSVLNEASLYVGEGASMASECAMLGTPAIYINSLNAGTLREQESYGLVHSFRTGDGVAEEAELIISQSNVKESYRERAAMMVLEKVDVTSMLVDISLGYVQENVKTAPVRYTKLKVAG
jgi:predicted glycosyltransferase